MQRNTQIDSAIVCVTNLGLKSRNFKQRKLLIKWQDLCKIILGAVSLLLILALPTIACGGLSYYHVSNVSFAAQLFFIPALALMSGYGLPLVAIVFSEAYILSSRESIPYLKACGFTALANVFYIIACFFSAIFWIFWPISLIGSVISAAMCVYFVQRTGYLKNISQRMFIFLIYLFFTGLGFANFFMVESISTSADRTLLYAVTGGILLTGFIFSFVMKGFAIARLLREKRLSLASTIMSMQVSSFPIIAIAYYLSHFYPLSY